MARNRGKQRTATVGTTGDFAARASAWAIALTVFATLFLVDVRAEAGFDAPKRFALVFGIAIATLLAALSKSVASVRPKSQALIGCVLAGIAIAASILSAAISPHRAVALQSLGIGAAVIAAMWLASTSLLDDAWERIATAFVSGAVLNSVIAIIQRGGIGVLRQEQVGGRSVASALIGNDGQLALIAAIALLIVTARLLTTKKRGALIAAAVPVLLVVILYRSITSLLLLAAGALLIAIRLAAPRVRLALSVVAAVALLIVLVLPFALLKSGRYDAASLDRALSYRLGPWASAAEMIRERPLTGFGPGTFSNEFMAHRFEAEQRWQRRLQNPFNASGGYGQSHDDYLQIASESGIFAAAGWLLAGIVVAFGIVRRRDGRDRESLTLIAVIAGVGVAALSWFPLRVPSTLLLTALCLGRGWRLLSVGDEGTEGVATASRWISAALATMLLLGVLPVELRRYSAERKLYRATGIAMAIAAGQAPRGAAVVLRQVLEDVDDAQNALPGDNRPPALRANAWLILGDPPQARVALRDALATGERGETDLAIAKAVDGEAAARAAYLRALWISDAVLPSLPTDLRDELARDVRGREQQLAAGKSWAVPPAVNP